MGVALAEKYRPLTLAEVVGQDKAVAKCRLWLKRDEVGGHAFMITGATGTGKTTIARILARSIADPLAIQEIDGSKLTPPQVDAYSLECRRRTLWNPPGHAFIVNEFHRLTPDSITRLLVALEPIPPWAGWFFTTTVSAFQSTFDPKVDSTPFLTRGHKLNLARRDLSGPFAQRTKQIAAAEGLDGKPVEEYEKLAHRCRNSLRDMIRAVGDFEMMEGD